MNPVLASVVVIQPASGLDHAQLLRQRREAIDTVSEELEALGPGAPAEKVTRVVVGALSQPPLEFLSALRGGSERVVEQSVQDYLRFTPNPASNAKTAAGLVRILLLQNIDLLWWDRTEDFVTRTDLQGAGLLDLVEERRAGRVDFSFGVGSDGLVRRARDYAVQRLAPRREPRGPGLAFTGIRPEMLSLLNDIAGHVHEAAPPRTPPIRVNSIIRTVEHQQHLRSLGFSALSPSAHCRGWAADIEVEWFERFGADGALREVMLGYLNEGVLNVIDEGRAWHVCLNPAFADRYAARRAD